METIETRSEHYRASEWGKAKRLTKKTWKEGVEKTAQELRIKYWKRAAVGLYTDKWKQIL